jgi:hypothetical protein
MSSWYQKLGGGVQEGVQYLNLDSTMAATTSVVVLTLTGANGSTISYLELFIRCIFCWKGTDHYQLFLVLRRPNSTALHCRQHQRFYKSDNLESP